MPSSNNSLLAPTVLPPPPRRVLGHADWGLWGGRLFCLPHMIIGIVALVVWVFHLLGAICYTVVQAEVTQAGVEHSSKHGDLYMLHYKYAVGGRDYFDTWDVSARVFLEYQDLARVPLEKRQVKARFFSLATYHESSLFMGESPWKTVGFLTLWVGFWDTAMAVAFRQLWVRPYRLRRLYRDGLVAPGVVISKRTVKGKSMSYYLTFIYEARSGEKVQVESHVSNEQTWRTANEGEVVTVLFDPEHPKRATVYEYGDHRVEIPPTMEPTQALASARARLL